jgi:hypothetical protein
MGAKLSVTGKVAEAAVDTTPSTTTGLVVESPLLETGYPVDRLSVPVPASWTLIRDGENVKLSVVPVMPLSAYTIGLKDVEFPGLGPRLSFHATATRSLLQGILYYALRLGAPGARGHIKFGTAIPGIGNAGIELSEGYVELKFNANSILVSFDEGEGTEPLFTLRTGVESADILGKLDTILGTLISSALSKFAAPAGPEVRLLFKHMKEEMCLDIRVPWCLLDHPSIPNGVRERVYAFQHRDAEEDSSTPQTTKPSTYIMGLYRTIYIYRRAVCWGEPTPPERVVSASTNLGEFLRDLKESAPMTVTTVVFKVGA